MTRRKRRSATTWFHKLNPWRKQGRDRRGRSYSRKLAVTPKNGWRGLLILVGAVVFGTALLQYGIDSLF